MYPPVRSSHLTVIVMLHCDISGLGGGMRMRSTGSYSVFIVTERDIENLYK